MIRKLKAIALGIGLFSLVAAPFAFPLTVAADDVLSNLKCGSNFHTESSGNNCDTTKDSLDFAGIMTLIINILSIVVGFIAVLMVIIGGVKYITSGGDSGNVTSAKNTIVYAIVGLVIVAVAQILVHFVLNKLGDASQHNHQ